MAAGGTVDRVSERTRQAVVAKTRLAFGGSRVLCTSGNGRLKSSVVDHLERLGAAVLVAQTLTDALSKLDGYRADVCVIDLTGERKLPASVRLLRTRHGGVPVVGLVDPADALLAGDAVQAGVYDVLPWPCDERDLALVLANAIERAPVEPSGGEPGGIGPLFAQAAAMRETLELARSIAGTRGAVLVLGEPGSGRRLLARTIHEWSADGVALPFVHFDCAADEALDVERRLFGVGQDRRPSEGAALPSVRVAEGGAIMAARGGTLFFEHVADLPARVQGFLARLLRDREAIFEGGDEVVDLDVRAIAALGTDVEQLVEDGRLQPELFDRLAQWRLEAPALRRRREDVPALAAWLLRQSVRSRNGTPKVLSRAALALLAALPWHGNAGELRQLMERLSRHVSSHVIQVEDLLEHTSLDGMSTRLEAGVTLKDAKARFERECITAVLRRHHGRVGEAAKALGIQRTNLYRKVRQLNVPRSLLSARR
jgi:DNA-binding NtrC family response regulator